MEFSDEQIDRYARHIVLREVGGPGQQKLLRSKVLIVGAGGLGSPMLLYLAAAGVGTIGIVDDDTVTLSNLQRQIAHHTNRIGVAKTASAIETGQAINPDVNFVAHHTRLTEANIFSIIGAYDIVADGSDNAGTRYLVNDACFFQRIPLVIGAIDRFDGQLATFRAYEEGDKPCYRCAFGKQPNTALDESCARDGVLGAVAGVIGSLQAVEVVKELLDLGDRPHDRLLIYDALAARMNSFKLPRNPDCPLCGGHPTITREMRFGPLAAPARVPATAE